MPKIPTLARAPLRPKSLRRRARSCPWLLRSTILRIPFRRLRPWSRADDARRVARRAEARHLSGHQACGEREDLERHARLRYQVGRLQHPREEAAASLHLYSGAPMPFMQRPTRSGTALHAGAIPGYPASHGCVRLPYSFAPKLFEMTSVGQNVVVTRGRPVPTPIEHPNLFELPPPKPPVAMAASVAVPRLLTDAVRFRPKATTTITPSQRSAPMRRCACW